MLFRYRPSVGGVVSRGGVAGETLPTGRPVVFGIGFWELVVIALVGFIVMDPKDLPAFFRRAGDTYRELVEINRRTRGYYERFRRGIDESVKADAVAPDDDDGEYRAGDTQKRRQGDADHGAPGRQ